MPGLFKFRVFKDCALRSYSPHVNPLVAWPQRISGHTTPEPTGDHGPSLVAPYSTQEVVVTDWQSTRVWEGAPAGDQPPDAGMVAFRVAPAGSLYDDGADLRWCQERQDLLLAGRLRGGPGGADDLYTVLWVEELSRGEAGIAPAAGVRGVRDCGGGEEPRGGG